MPGAGQLRIEAIKMSQEAAWSFSSWTQMVLLLLLPGVPVR